MSEPKNDPWMEVVTAKTGTIFADWMEGDVRCLIIKGGACLCAYVGVPSRHRKAGFDYKDMPLDCHGGLTFAEKGGAKGLPHPDGWYWYGWDYAHSGDALTFRFDPQHLGVALTGLFAPSLHRRLVPFFREEHRWTVEEVRAEIPAVAQQLSSLRMHRLKGKRRRWIKSDPRKRERAKLDAKLEQMSKELGIATKYRPKL
jgi:hypothetical protein